ncbi:hypothetical protein [Bradyrhizobium sp. CCGUVB23]|uniref:hypothetical protein n=1 Tax=Bradyrhizobium sp. CCGUVB23 TaxID=2949630 RepID=UPI0020B32322|nr:hypothetical protein [Bradyrhizobium sp. CCGUVB23]MCP3462536.1 hypothetical protein [Bradyrhizobium sp. CCGUVB23]
MANGLIEADVLAIVRAVANGQTERDVAKAFGLSIAAVRDVVSQAAGDRLSGEAMRREILLEVTRLDQLLAKYHSEALSDEPHRHASAAIYHKLAQRKHEVCGLSPATGVGFTIITSTPAPQQRTSTDQLREVLDELIGKQQPALPKPDDVIH